MQRLTRACDSFPVGWWSFCPDYAGRPIYIQTNHAIYILNLPAKQYEKTFSKFFRPRKIAQIVTSSLWESRTQKYEAFVNELREINDPLVPNIRETDLGDAVCVRMVQLDHVADFPLSGRISVLPSSIQTHRSPARK